MTSGARRLVIVGGGILGMMHAIEAVRRGYDVVQLERDHTPQGASVRNFGLIWVSGRARGRELDLARRARERWEAIAATAPGTGFRADGSVTIARDPAELAVIEEVAGRNDAEERGLRILDPDEARRVNPTLKGSLLGALFCERDAIVEPRLVLGALRAHLERTGSYLFLPGRVVVDVVDNGVIDHTGAHYHGDLVVCCVGAESGGFLAEALRDAPIRRVQLQMLETKPFDHSFPTAIADGDSLRYYPTFEGPVRDQLPPQHPVAADWRAQLLLVRRLGGHLTIGDTHRYEEPFAFDVADEPSSYLLRVADELLGPGVPPVERRWTGVYCEVTDPNLLYYRAEVAPGVMVVTGPGGRGMTMSPAIAAETFE